MKRLGFNSKLLLCLLMLCARPFGAARAQESIDIGAEVWIEPGQTPEQIDGWFSLAANNGMRSVRLFLMWNYIEKQPGEFDFSLYDTAFAAANRHKVRIEATLCAIHGPAWLSEKFRGRPQFNELFDSEQVLVRAAEYIRQTVTRYRDDQALESWWVLNEPRRFDPRSPLATARLQEWAAAKYSTVEAVNEAWIEHYTDFSQIVYNPLWERGNYFYWPVPTVDWYQFQRDFLTWNLRWIADNIRRYDTRHIITMNPANVFESAHQYNLPAYREIFDIYGASMHASWQLRLLPRDNYGYAVAGISEILRGAAPEGRFWVSELQGGNNIWSGKTPMCPDSLDLAQWIWTGIGSGARKVVYWSLNYRKQGIEAGEWGVFGFRSEATDRSRVTAEMNRVLARHNDFFSGAKPWQGTVTLLLSPETMRLLLHIDPFECGARRFDRNAHIQSLLSWFMALQKMGCQVDIRYLQDYDWESEQTGRVAILADMIGIPDTIIPRMERFVSAGNKLIGEGLTGFFDEYETNTMQSEFAMERLLGGRMTDLRMRDSLNSIRIDGLKADLQAYMWKPFVEATTGTPAGRHDEGVCALRNHLGKGETLWIPACVSMGSRDIGTRELARLAAAEIEPNLKSQPFRFGAYAEGLLLRILCNGDRYVTVITNNRSEAASARLIAPPGLRPEIIFGTGLSADGRRIRLGGRQTVVVLWK